MILFSPAWPHITIRSLKGGSKKKEAGKEEQKESRKRKRKRKEQQKKQKTKKQAHDANERSINRCFQSPFPRHEPTPSFQRIFHGNFIQNIHIFAIRFKLKPDGTWQKESDVNIRGVQFISDYLSDLRLPAQFLYIFLVFPFPLFISSFFSFSSFNWHARFTLY